MQYVRENYVFCSPKVQPSDTEGSTMQWLKVSLLEWGSVRKVRPRALKLTFRVYSNLLEHQWYYFFRRIERGEKKIHKTLNIFYMQKQRTTVVMLIKS